MEEKKCGVCKFHWNLDVPPLPHSINCPRADDELMSCCQSCGNRYKVDLMLPDEIWQAIGPPNGVLCGICIVSKLEMLGNAYFNLTKLDELGLALRAMPQAKLNQLLREQLDDPNEAAAIVRSLADVVAGRTRTHEQVKREIESRRKYPLAAIDTTNSDSDL